METNQPLTQPSPPQAASPPPPAKKESPKILHQLEGGNEGWGKAFLFAGALLLIVAAGAFTGYFLSKRGIGPMMISTGGQVEQASGPNEVGVKDEEVFRDTAEGRIEANDFSVTDEGSHKLIRPGGDSQTAYLTSSVINLDQFIGKCVQVWGETFAAQKAGWLMDVGRLKILDKCPEGV